MNIEFSTKNFIYVISTIYIVVEYFALLIQKKKYPILESISVMANIYLKKYFFHFLFFIGYSEINFSLQRYKLLSIEVNDWILVIVLIIVVDFAYYWTHRIMHGINFFWIMHSVHHLPSRLTFLTALQRPILGHIIPLFSVIAIPVVVLGFDQKLIFYYMGLNLTYQSWLHNEFVGKLGILEYVFNTPAQHRIHHSVLSVHSNKNFGGILCIFDRMFGTYHLDDIECINFGILPLVKITSPLTPVFYEFTQFKKLILNIIKVQGLKNKISALVKV